MKKKLKFLILASIYPLLDFIIITLATLSSYFLYRFLGIGKQVYYSISFIVTISLLLASISIIVLLIFGAYKKESSILNVQEIKNVTKGITISFMVFIVFIIFIKIAPSRYVLILSYIFSLLFLVLERTLLYHLLPLSSLFNSAHKKILIYGAGELGKSLYRSIVNSPKLGIKPLGFIDDDPKKRKHIIYKSGFNCKEGIAVLGNRKDIKKLKKKFEIDEIYIAISNIDRHRLFNILSFIKSQNTRVSFVPNLYNVSINKLKIDKIEDIPLVKEEEEEIYKNLYLYFKRYIDFIISLFLIILFLPLFVIIAFLIKIDSKGPVFFKQDRVGKNAKIFQMLKFRSMYIDTKAYTPKPLSNKDPSITRVGRFLRKISLDELPQLINILKGDMSIVGPRPEMPFIVEKYNEVHKKRLQVLPGITGLWQLSGDRNKPIHENINYDLYYIRNVSFFLDLAILIETIFFAFKGI